MIIGETPFYLLRYPWAGDIPCDAVADIANTIGQEIEKYDPGALLLVLPSNMSLEKMTRQELKDIHSWLGNYIDNYDNYQEEEEN